MNELFEFSDDEFANLIENAETEKASARAHRTKTRKNIRRAKSEALLAEILPPVIAEGDSWHVLSSGDVDALSFFAHLVKATPMDYVLFSTWCMAMSDVTAFSDWLKSGQIKRLDAYVGEIFPNQYIAEHLALCEIVKPAGRCAVFRNHSKIFACRSGDQAWVIESSANINTNPRTENTVITADMGLFLHHKAYFDGVRSFNRDFDNWTPA
jgi:hypothetical protein